MDRPAGRLLGSTCLIVGGTSGIGLAATRRFLDEGAVVLAAGREPASGWGTMPGSPRLTVHHLELGDGLPGIAAMFAEAGRALGDRLDILLHVAGGSGRRHGDGPLDACTDEGWDRTVELNARSVFLTNREAVRIMLTQPIDRHGLRGSIVNIGSVLSESPSPAHFATVAYAASKGAVRSLTLASAARYAPERVRFNLIEPGLIDTPMAARALGDPSIGDYLHRKQPMADGPGSAADVAEAALALCDPATRFITGVVLPVDGGWRISDGGGDVFQ